MISAHQHAAVLSQRQWPGVSWMKMVKQKEQEEAAGLVWRVREGGGRQRLLLALEGVMVAIVAALRMIMRR